MESQIKENLNLLYESVTGEKAASIEAFPQSGSNRQYYRLQGKQNIIGVYNEDKAENKAFLYFATHFKKHQLPVPEIYASDEEKNIYLQEDLGENTLFSYIETDNKARRRYHIAKLPACHPESL
mgnify:CR=1 FL=1